MTEPTKCPYCLGSGKEYSSGHMTVDGWRDADTCSWCNGTGLTNKDSVTTTSPGSLTQSSTDSPETYSTGSDKLARTVQESITDIKGAKFKVELRGNVIDALAFKPGVGVHVEQIENVEKLIQTYTTNQTIEVLEAIQAGADLDGDPYEQTTRYYDAIDATIKELKERL